MRGETLTAASGEGATPIAATDGDRLPSDLLGATLALFLWVAFASLVLAIADGLGPDPARRIAIGLVLVLVSAVALWRRGLVCASLRVRPWLVVPVAAAQLGMAIADGVVGGPYVAFSLTSVGLAVIVARARTVWLCVALLDAGYATAVLLEHSPATLAHDGDLDGAIGALVSYPVAALIFLGLRRRFTRFVAAVEPTLDEMRDGAPALTPALTRAIGGAPLALPGAPAAHLRLTPAERRVVDGLADGHAPKELAHRWGVSLSTVRTQIRHAKRKTGARTLRELAAMASDPDWPHVSGRGA